MFCFDFRIGTLVLIIFDCSDPLLELAKLCKYVKRDQLAEIVFGVFTLTWVFTRYKVIFQENLSINTHSFKSRKVSFDIRY